MIQVPTALYTRVATNTIREVMSPLDRLTPLRPKKDETKDATKQKAKNETKDEPWLPKNCSCPAQ